MIRFLFFLFLVIPPSLNAQSSWETVTGDLPLPQRYLNTDGSVRASRLFQLEDQVIVSTDLSLGKSVLISTSDGLSWKIYPESLPENRFNVISRVQTPRRFSSLDPVANLRLMIPIGQASRLEVTYRNSEGTFLATGYPGEPFEFPSPGATKISEETSQALAVLSGEFINFPDLPDGQITNLARIGNALIAQIGASQRGHLYSWCPDCGSRELQGTWRNLSGQGAIDTKPQKMAGGSTNGFILQSPIVSSVTEVRKTTFGVRQSIGGAPDDTLHDIAWDSDTFIVVGADFDFSSNSTTGLILRKVGTQDWQTISVPEANEFLSISHGSLGWLATVTDGEIWSSANGSVWNLMGEAPFPIASLAEIDSHWIATSTLGAVHSSTDLSSWTQQLEDYSGIRGIAGAQTHFLALGIAGLVRSPVDQVSILDYPQWIDFHGVTNDLSAPEASAAGDRFSNIFRYVAGLSPFEDADNAFIQIEIYRESETEDDYLTILIRNRPLPIGATLIVEQSTSLAFGGIEAVEIGNPITHSDQTVSRRYRTSQPISATSKQFLRVRVSSSPE
jgi:hypothetical protein